MTDSPDAGDTKWNVRVTRRSRRGDSSLISRQMRHRLRRLFMIGSATVAVLYAIDPEWPVHLRRSLQVLQMIFGRSNGYVLRLLLHWRG
jgi:hypothetical protein